MTTFLTADTHFGHKNIIRFCDRPFADTEEMQRVIISNWNSIVHPRDIVWHLGDFGIGLTDAETLELFQQLNGTIKLVIGNHDVDRKGRLIQSLARLPWATPPTHHAEIKHDKKRIILSHYAGLTWNNAHHGSYQAFGHSHGQLKSLPRSIDVGVDAQNFRPISVDEFIRQADETVLNAEERIEDVITSLRQLAQRYKDPITEPEDRLDQD